MAYINVDVDLDEFETYELIEELLKRFKSFRNKAQVTDKQKKELQEELQPLLKELKISPLPYLEIKTLDDRMKFEFMTQVWNRYTSFQFERLFQ